MTTTWPKARARGAVVCSLFRGNYHLGFGALVNSLCAHGYQGVVWAGHRGPLPSWASQATPGDGYRQLHVTDEVMIKFVPINTDQHLTLYKPRFLLQLADQYDPDAESLVYIDPDIVVLQPWNFFENWLGFGIALCEDLESLHHTDPMRLLWRRNYKKWGVQFARSLDTSVNAGYVGVPRAQLEFVRVWDQLLLHLLEETGTTEDPLGTMERFRLFAKSDQDALNMALECCDQPYTLAGLYGMGFDGGQALMAHAIGRKKPWEGRHLLDGIQGFPPTRATKAYFRYVSEPIRLYSALQVRAKRWELLAATAFGRLIKRN